MAPAGKLTYFDIRGRAELSRMILAYSAVEFEDNRIKSEDWPELKPQTPFGQLPIYEENGLVLAQSRAIARYLARKNNLVGKDDWEAAQCDMVVDACADLVTPYIKAKVAGDEAAIKTESEKLLKDRVPFYFGRFEKMIKSNTSGYIVGEKVTWADFSVVEVYEGLNETFKDELPANDTLKELFEKMSNYENIKAYCAKRPSKIV